MMVLDVTTKALLIDDLKSGTVHLGKGASEDEARVVGESEAGWERGRRWRKGGGRVE